MMKILIVFVIYGFVSFEIVKESNASIENFHHMRSLNEKLQSEVNEVLHLLGVDNNENTDLKVNKRLQSSLHDVRALNSNGKQSGFKWQYTVIASVCSVAAVFGTVLAATCYYKMSRASGNGPLIGSRSSTGSNGSAIVALGGSSAGDKKLAQSAQMYHYQHQKQQMIALEKADAEYRNEGSDEESEPEDALDDYTVYECPGMAMAGELDVKNPMFQSDPQTPPGKNQSGSGLGDNTKK